MVAPGDLWVEASVKKLERLKLLRTLLSDSDVLAQPLSFSLAMEILCPPNMENPPDFNGRVFTLLRPIAMPPS